MSRPAGRPPLITRDFLLLTGAHLLQALGYSSMLLLPLYMHHLGASRASIGAIMAASSIGGLALRPLVGWSLDALGRKPTVIVSTVIASCAMGLIFFVTSDGWMVYALRALYGVGVGGMFTGYFTLAADLIPESRRTEGIALFGISGLIPLALNPVATESGITPADIRWYLPIVGVVVLASLVLLVPLPEPGGPRGRRGRMALRRAAAALLSRPLWPVWLSTVAFSGLVGLFFTFASVAGEARGVARPAAVWMTYAGGAVAVRLFGGRLPDLVGPSNLIAPALGCYATGCLAAAGATDQSGFLLAGLLAGFGHGYCFPVLTSQVVTRVDDALRGSGLALFTAIWDGTALAVPPAFGAFADRYDDRAMFALAALISIGALSVWAALEHRLGAPHVVAPRGT